jgi:hypothetical protein
MSDSPLVAVAGFSLAAFALRYVTNTLNARSAAKKDTGYSLPDQPQRFANAKKANCTRVMDIDALYNPSFVRGKNVLVTGKILAFNIFFLAIDIHGVV